MEAISRLRDRVAETGEAQGLILQGFFVVPAEPGCPPRAQAIFELDPKKVFASDEQRAFDDQFDDIAAGFGKDDEATKIQNARDELMRDLGDLRRPSKGIGLDEDAA